MAITPNGAVFDKLVMEALLKQNLSGLSDLSRSFIDEIATCGLPSVYFLFGVLRHFRPVMPVYAYEAPFGVGYGVALYLPEGQEDQVEKRAPRTSASAWPAKALPTTCSITL